MRALKINNEIPTNFKIPVNSGGIVTLGGLYFLANQRHEEKAASGEMLIPVQLSFQVFASEADYLAKADPVPGLTDFPQGNVVGFIAVEKFYNGQSIELESLDIVKAAFEAKYQGKVQVIEINDADIPLIEVNAK